jgi:lipid-A-disaccharide synthase
MRRKDPSIIFYGIGGPELKDKGVSILVDASDLAVVGITEVLNKVSSIHKAISLVKKTLRTRRPDLLILIDFPDFNLHLAAYAKKLNIPVLYYICPQVWAWRAGRVKKLSRLIDHLAVILPFEKNLFKKYNIPVTFVGHPLLDNDIFKQDDLLEKAREGTPVIGLLPGSRDTEIARHLPVMLQAAQILHQRLKNIEFIISLAPSIERGYVENIITNQTNGAVFKIGTNGLSEIFMKSQLVIAASGTVTLESAIFGVPMVIIYKVSPLSYRLGRALIRVEHVGLVNLVAGKRIVPELLQDEASPVRIADTAHSMLNDAAGRKKLRHELQGIKKSLGGPGASDRVADIALDMLSS